MPLSAKRSLRMKCLRGLAIGLAMIGVALPSAAQEFKAVSPQLVEKLRAALDDFLLDSESARFKDVKIVDPGESSWDGTVCGKINSKNAMGAYVGYRTFIGYVGGTDRSDPVALVLGIDDGESQVATTMCSSKYNYQ